MKRLFDFFIALSLFFLVWPVFLIVALCIKIDDRGPIFFCQKRIGLNRKVFNIYKFRSMVIDAEQKGGFSTVSGDQRITRIGKVLRKTSLDELPQLFNVISGDMSLVGPRPDVPQQSSLYVEEDWVERHKVRPGITGLAQSGLRSSATHEERLAMDLSYVRTNSFLGDLIILFKTAQQVIRKGGV